ncbi:MAG: 4,5-dihydroxyphthalate dehydrogenase [Betaproteobacteria bacterium RIFCSPLOWO2_02_FULL_62_17]|nr:MAG: 4,5-dihydroxyphthalate dehydrogenase [Betaproteobacteria bacterium RIFCSPLOWO2_02_FULL_62_17]
MFASAALRKGLVVLALLLPFQSAFAQGARYPEKPVRVLVGYAPGGLPDTVARIVSQKMGERWGQQAVIENRAGANSGLAAELVANAPPDGYTLLVTDNSTHAINPFLYRKLPYDPARLLPISLVARAPLYLAAHSSFPANTLNEAIALLKANPGKFTFGSSGIGSTHHLCMEFFKATLGLNMAHVPYKGTGQSVPALIAGQVPLVWSAYPSLAGSAKDGRIKLLAVNSLRRSSSAPNLPAIAELIPGFDFAPTIGFFAPAGTPRELIARISNDANEAVKSADVIAKLAGLDVQTVGSTPEEYAASLKSDEGRYAKAVKISGATAD